MKLKTKLFFFIIILSISYSCGSKKTVTEYKEVVKKDSIYITKDRYITKQVNDTILIKEICDTLTGLKNFDRQIHSNGVKVSIKSVNGDLKTTVNIDSIVNYKVYEFKQNYKTKTEVKKVEIVRYKTHLWMWLTIIIEALLIFILIKFKFL